MNKFKVGQKVKWGSLFGEVKMLYKNEKKKMVSCEFIHDDKLVVVNFFLDGLMEFDCKYLEHNRLEIVR